MSKNLNIIMKQGRAELGQTQSSFVLYIWFEIINLLAGSPHLYNYSAEYLTSKLRLFGKLIDLVNTREDKIKCFTLISLMIKYYFFKYLTLRTKHSVLC